MVNAVVLNRLIRAVQRLHVVAVAANDSATRGLDVAARYVVVRLAEYGIRLVEDVQRLFRVALLKDKPAMLNLNHSGDDCDIGQRDCERAGGVDVLECLDVVSFSETGPLF